MTKPVISVEHLTKQYDLGVIGTGTISRDLNRWWARVRKQPDPYTRIGQQDAFARIGETILALDDVSFTVQQGEVLGIIGRNGAGKSTLLKILSRVTAPSSGVVKVKGRIGSLLEVGTGFHPELTGRENVYLNGAILGMKKEEVTRKFDEIVDFSGVEKFIDTPVKRYSSGMYVRLAFAVAAHLESEILIVDEVLAVGDAEFQKKCLGKMGKVASQEGRTVLFVSHNMGAIKTLCLKGLLLIAGELTSYGDADDIIDAYLNGQEEKYVEFKKFGTSNVTVENFTVTDTEQRKIAYIDTDTPFSINVFYRVNKEGFYGFTLSLVRDGVFVFQSMNSQDPTYEDKKTTGNYRTTCHIPGMLLNNGKYSITFNIYENNYSNSVVFSDIYSFDVIDGNMIRKNYFGGYLGGIRPLLEWHTIKLTN